MKEGPAEDFTNKEKVAKLLQFTTTHSEVDDQEENFEEYVSRMQEGQEKIYYVAAESLNAARNSPHLEIFQKS